MSKHLTLDERKTIQLQLDAGVSVSEIAAMLGKAKSTIAREIQKHRLEKNTGAFGKINNRCSLRKECDKRYCCPEKTDCVRKCAQCHACNKRCPDFLEEYCSKLENSPHVCNSCQELHRCVLRKYLYDARHSDERYRTLLAESRQGFNLTMQEVELIDSIVSPCIINGQSVHHVWVNNADRLPVGERTIQRMIHGRLLTAKVLDQQRVCKLKPRKGKERQQAKIDRRCRIGRTLGDYNDFVGKHLDIATVEMDSVIGKKGGKVFLTLIFPTSELMLVFLRDSNTSQTAIDCIQFLYEGLGKEDFCKLFPVLLTDNGSEFSNPKAFEFTEDGFQRTHIFYCDPMASYQKPHVERNHEFIREILPKGHSFDNLTQEDVDLMASHINSYKRQALGNKSPMEMFAFQYGNAIAEKLLRLVCLREIPANEIVLRPALLRH